MAARNLQLPAEMRNISDEAWFDLLIQSISSRHIKGIEFPTFPPSEVQVRFVGSSYEQALKEALSYYEFVKMEARALGKPFGPTTRILDFGCGWGRFLRFFWKDIAPENMFGCDVLPAAIEMCRSAGVPGNLDLIESEGGLPYPDRSFDVIIAYSVFTHLPERLNLHWMRELARVSKTGCVFCLTLEPRGFIDRISNAAAEPNNAFLRSLSRYAPNAEDLYRVFDAGKVVYLPTGGGDNLTPDVYGDAIVPIEYIRRNWSPLFVVKKYVDFPKERWRQALVVVQSP